MRFVFSLLLLILLGGCASAPMDKAECMAGDWRAIGYEDGASGKNPQYFGVRRKACAEYGVVANFDAYMSGRDEGLVHFCDPTNAYNVGASGVRYDGVCPAAKEAAFLAEYHKGYGLYERAQTLEQARKKLNYKRNRNNTIERQLADKLAAMAKADATVDERVSLGVDIKQLTDEKIRIGSEIGQLEADYDRAQRAYDEYRRHTSPAHY